MATTSKMIQCITYMHIVTLPVCICSKSTISSSVSKIKHYTNNIQLIRKNNIFDYIFGKSVNMEGKKMNNIKNKTPAGPGLRSRIRQKLTKRRRDVFREKLFIYLHVFLYLYLYYLKICCHFDLIFGCLGVDRISEDEGEKKKK